MTDNIIWKKYGSVRYARENNIIGWMGSTCWLTKSTNTHSKYVIFDSVQRQLQ
jgi:hypothetical protein